VPVDFIHIDEVAEKGGRYKMIYLPYPLMISESAGKALRAYVQNGGALVSEARLAWNDERGRATEIIPGQGLHQVCGCREATIQQTASGKTELQLAVDFAGLKAGDKIRGHLYEESLEALSPATRVMARFADNSPAIVASEFGKGKMLIIGTFLGTAFELDRDETSGRFFRGLLDWAGVVRPVQTSDPNVEVRILESGAERILFIFNHGAALTPTITLRTADGPYTIRDLESGEKSDIAAQNGRVTFEKPLPANGAAVIVVMRR
jgi:beta-galactosidase